MNLDAFRHKVSQSQQHRSQVTVCTKCMSFFRFDIHAKCGFCDGFIRQATNEAFGTTFDKGTPIPILADYIEERDDGSPEFGELVAFLRGIT